MIDGTRFFASVTPLSLLHLGDGVGELVRAGVDGLHLDIADGHFAPFLLFPPRLAGDLVAEVGGHVEVHLMVTDPEAYIPQLAARGVRRIAFHAEATAHPWRVASLARSHGVEVGVSLNLATSVEVVRSLGSAVDFVNLLGADHDFAGDRLLPVAFDRVRSARALAGPAIRIQVDGGVGPDNAVALVRAGAQDLVIGRALCDAPDRSAMLRALRAAVVAAEA